MAPITMQQVREKYPDYADLSDQDLAKKLHQAFYSDIPIEQFNSQVGLGTSIQATPGNIFEAHAKSDINALEDAGIPRDKETVTNLAIQSGIGDVARAGMAIGVPAATAALSAPLAAYGAAGGPVARGLAYAGNAAIDTAMQYGSNKLQQDVGIQSPTTGAQDLDRALSTATTDILIPGAIDLAALPISGAANLINSPKALAKGLGATAGQMNESSARKTVDKAIAEMMPNQEFRDSVIGNVSINKAYSNLKQMRQATGNDIGEIYRNSSGLGIDTNSVLAHPEIRDIESVLNNPYTPPEIKAVVQREYNDFLGIINQKPVHEVGDLWYFRKQTDDLIDFAKKSNNLTVKEATKEGIRTALSDNITKSLEAAPGATQGIKDLNSRYNNLSIIEEALARKSGAVSDSFLGFDTTQFGKLSTYLKMAAAGGGIRAATIPYITGNAGRAMLFKGGQAVQGAGPLASQGMALVSNPLDQFETPRSPLIPRQWEAIKTDSQHISNLAMIAANLGILPPNQSLSDLPDEQAKQIIGLIAGTLPQAFIPTPDKINAFDGDFVDAIGKESIYKKVQGMPLEKQARIMAAAYDNKYLPLEEETPKPLPAQPMPNLSSINQGLTSTLKQAPDYSYDNSNTAMLEELTKSRIIHDTDIQ